MRRLALLGLLALTACFLVHPAAPSRWPASGRPDGTRLRFRGNMVVGESSGLIILRLHERACLDRAGRGVTCDAFPEDGLADTYLRTPWGARARASAGGNGYLSFRVEWAETTIDPLDERSLEVLTAPWTFESRFAADNDTVWIPTAEDGQTMRTIIGKVTHTEIDIAEVGDAPRLTVVSFQPDGELRNGTRTKLTLRIRNEGVGDAYRVRVRTRSSIPALHGLVFSFGALPSGTSKFRALDVELPRDNEELEAVLVLDFDEANGYEPASSNARFKVREALAAPTLRIVCQLRGLDGTRPVVDAGQALEVDCSVQNTGAPVDDVQLEVWVTGGKIRRRSGTFDLYTDQQHQVNLAILVPRTAKIDEVLELVVEAHDLGKRAPPVEIRLPLVLSRQRICPEGKLSRTVFRDKRDQLRKAYADGLISKDDLDAYEAELVGCLE